MKLPNIDLAELGREKKRNFQERLKFIEFYANRVKKSSSWDKEQKKLME